MSTLTSRIKLAEFSSLSDTDQEHRVSRLVNDTVSPSPELLKEQQATLNQRIHRFETQYKMSSQEMKDSVRSGSIAESTDFCTWLMLLGIRDRFEESI